MRMIDTETTPIPRTPNTPEPQAGKQTWLQWLPAGEPEPTLDDLIQRDELMRRLARRDIDMSKRTLQRWEASGLVPSPIRRWYDGGMRSLYPWWNEELVVLAHELKKTQTEDRPWGIKTDYDITRSLKSYLFWVIRQASIKAHPYVQETVTNALLGLGEILNQEGQYHAAKADLIISTPSGQIFFELSVNLDPHSHADSSDKN